MFKVSLLIALFFAPNIFSWSSVSDEIDYTDSSSEEEESQLPKSSMSPQYILGFMLAGNKQKLNPLYTAFVKEYEIIKIHNELNPNQQMKLPTPPVFVAKKFEKSFTIFLMENVNSDGIVELVEPDWADVYDLREKKRPVVKVFYRFSNMHHVFTVGKVIVKIKTSFRLANLMHFSFLTKVERENILDAINSALSKKDKRPRDEDEASKESRKKSRHSSGSTKKI